MRAIAKLRPSPQTIPIFTSVGVLIFGLIQALIIF